MRNVVYEEKERDDFLLNEMREWCVLTQTMTLGELKSHAVKYRADWDKLLSCPHGYAPMMEFLGDVKQ